MTTTLLEALALATGGLFSIGSTIAVILFLSSKRGLQKGLAYYLGYTGIYFLMGTGILILGNRISAKTPEPVENSSFWPVVTIAMGVLLLFFALKQWRSPSDNTPRMKKVLDRLNSLNPLQTFLFGALIPFINFKKLPIFLSAVSVIMEGGLSFYEELASVTAVTVLFNAGIGAPILLYVSFGSRAVIWLEAFRRGLDRHNRSVSITIMTIFGILFILRGVFQMM